MLADLSHGHTDFADWMFLLALVIFVIVVIIRAIPQNRVLDMVLLPLGLAAMSLAFFVL